MFVASDVAALVAHTRQVVTLDDGEMATLKADDFRTYTTEGSRTTADADHRGVGGRVVRHGRPRHVHAQGDLRAGRRRGPGAARPDRRPVLHRAPRRPEPGRPRGARRAPGEDPRLRHLLPRGPDRRPDDRGAGPHPRGRRARLRVPLPQPGRGPRHALRRGLPVRRDLRRAGRRPGAEAQGRPGARAWSTSSAPRSPARRTAGCTCTRAPRSAWSPPSASPTPWSPSRCSPCTWAGSATCRSRDGKRIIEGLRRLPGADRRDPRAARTEIKKLAERVRRRHVDDVHRPGPRLPGGPRGLAEAQGGLATSTPRRTRPPS